MSYWKNWLKTILNKVNIIILFLLVFCSFSMIQAFADEPRKAVIVMCNYTSLEDWIQMPHILELTEHSGIALMNTRGASRTDAVRAYASLGWGTRADALLEQCLLKEEDGYTQVVGTQDIKELNAHNTYNVRVGALGDFFISNGLTTAFIGVQQNSYNLYAPGALIAMDSQGEISHHVRIAGNKELEQLYRKFERVYEEHHLTVIDLVDIEGWQAYNSFEKQEMLMQMDAFIGHVLKTIDTQQTLLIILSSHYSSQAAREGKRLAPVLFFQNNIPSGVLLSDTTRRPGIIANIDIAPSVVDFFGGSMLGVVGEPIRIKTREQPMQRLYTLYEQTTFNARYRVNILKTYISFQIILLVTALIVLMFNRRLRYRWIYSMLCFCILFIITCPLTLFLMPLLRVVNVNIYVALLVMLNGILAATIYYAFNTVQNRVIAIALVTAAVISADLVFGWDLNKTSILGYDAVIGARYYGLGNEYMGVLIGAVLLTVVPLVHKKVLSVKVGSILLFALVPIIGLSIFGANVGGTITSVVAFSFAIVKMRSKPITLKTIMGIGVVLFGVIGMLVIYDVWFATAQSHLAKALWGWESDGWTVIISTIQRKLEMNLRLLRYTIWSRVLLTSVIVLVLLFLRPKGMLMRLMNKYSGFSIAWYAIIVASIAGIMVNDSGVVVAATANIFLMFSLLYFTLGEVYEK